MPSSRDEVMPRKANVIIVTWNIRADDHLLSSAHDLLSLSPR